MGLSVRDADVSRLTPAAPAASRTAVQSIAEQATGGSVSLPFESVGAEKLNAVWYTDAVIWALSEKLIAVLFWRCQNKPAVQDAELSNFTDADDISDWARDAFSWAVSVGVISGKGNGILDPAGVATRAEVAQIVMNYSTKVK